MDEVGFGVSLGCKELTGIHVHSLYGVGGDRC